MSAPIAAGRPALPGFGAFPPPGSPVGSALAVVPGGRAADFPATAMALARRGAGHPNPPDRAGLR